MLTEHKTTFTVAHTDLSVSPCSISTSPGKMPDQKSALARKGSKAKHVATTTEEQTNHYISQQPAMPTQIVARMKHEKRFDSYTQRNLKVQESEIKANNNGERRGKIQPNTQKSAEVARNHYFRRKTRKHNIKPFLPPPTKEKERNMLHSERAQDP